MNVAVVNTGPGVICPAATASRSWASLSQPRASTRSARKKATSTYPLPNSTLPIFRKTRKMPPVVTLGAVAAASAGSPATTAGAPALPGDERLAAARAAAPPSTASSGTPRAHVSTAASPIATSPALFTATRARLKSACATMATMTGFMP